MTASDRTIAGGSHYCKLPVGAEFEPEQKRCIQKPVKRLRWSVFRDVLSENLSFDHVR